MIKFIVKCQVCRWKSDIKDNQNFEELTPVTNGCSKCSGKKFKCPKCGRYARMHRILSK